MCKGISTVLARTECWVKAAIVISKAGSSLLPSQTKRQPSIFQRAATTLSYRGAALFLSEHFLPWDPFSFGFLFFRKAVSFTKGRDLA